ncbi:MAG TPA: STAS domain-containing protein [Candidatus Polarisedimenticolia bacterium]|nr:STAS domain-containing protein [Candidatus Polarisedimenticolia bacterium]
MSNNTHGTGRAVRLSIKDVASGEGTGSLRSLVELALRQGARRIEIDASGVAFLDAAGLGELVACGNLARRAGAGFSLRGVSGKTLELLRLTGLDRRLVPPDPSGVFGWRVA